MNRHALTVLQYPEALAVVAGHASSALGREAVESLLPSDAVGWIEPELRRVDQMAAFLLRDEEWAIPPIPDLRVPLRRLGVPGTAWEGGWLRDAATLIGSARRARRALRGSAPDYPLLAELADRIEELDAEAERIGRAIDDAGDVRDGASRELTRIRRELRVARARIVQRLEAFMASVPERYRVANASVSVRDGRYVIPVRREGRAGIRGIVHDESSTGATLFIEPPVAIELMNRLRELELAEAREVQRILLELTDRLRPHRDALRTNLDTLVALDSLHARARYALVRNAKRPTVRDADATLTIVDGRHPLLLEGAERVVPFDLRLEPGERTLLVSGPNTGGKTVLLKAVGLFSALAQAGVVPPVGAGTELPVFRDIFADIGDEQSIEASLSTFSAHLRNLREIVDDADVRSLVLIDEIGSGTDPAEGGALAQAILVELTRRGACTVATSHLGQLKLLAGEQPGVVNASLQFDSRELRPTFRLMKGVPGRSYGIAIARRLGFPPPLLEAAESFLPDAERDTSQLLLELEEKERQMAEALAEATTARQEAETLRAELHERESGLRHREQDAERRSRQQARALLLSARAEVDAAIEELRRRLETDPDGRLDFEDAARRARRRVEQAAHRQAERAPAPASESAGVAVAPDELDAGAWVRIRATGATGRVVEVRDGRALVETRGVRLQLPLDALERTEAPESPTPARPEPVVWSGSDVAAATEIDLRGLRADEVRGRLDPAVDAALRADLPSLRIIHGKGTGALREVVAELLGQDPRVPSFRPGGIGEGGTGVTVVEFG